MQSESQFAGRSHQTVLRALHAHGPLTLRQLQEHTGFSHAAVAASVGMLRGRGLVATTGVRRSDGLGRPSALWHLRPEAAHAVGIDVGATATRVLLLDLAGYPVYSYHEDTAALYRRAPGGASVARELSALARRAIESGPAPDLRPGAVGVALSGLIDSEHGRCLTCTNIPGWQDLRIVADLSGLLGVPVLLEDSARAQALAEQRYGRAQGLRDFLYVNVGVGIGAALFIDGRLYRGPGGLGGELGHITVDERGPRCGCGNRGCAEAVVGARAIVRRAADLLAHSTYPSVLADTLRRQVEEGPDQYNVAPVAAAAAMGDTLAFRVLNEVGEYLGIAIAAALNLLGSPLVVLGGGVVHAGEPFVGAVRRSVMLRALPPLARQVRVEASMLDDDAGARGVGLSAIEAYLRSVV